MRSRKEENKCSNTDTKLTLRKSTATIKILKNYPGITDMGRETYKYGIQGSNLFSGI